MVSRGIKELRHSIFLPIWKSGGGISIPSTSQLFKTKLSIFLTSPRACMSILKMWREKRICKNCRHTYPQHNHGWISHYSYVPIRCHQKSARRLVRPWKEEENLGGMERPLLKSIIWLKEDVNMKSKQGGYGVTGNTATRKANTATNMEFLISSSGTWTISQTWQGRINWC